MPLDPERTVSPALDRRRLLWGVAAGLAVAPLAGCGVTSGSDARTRKAGQPVSQSQELNGRRLPPDLPPGRLVAPRDLRTGRPVGDPVLWVSDRPLGDVGVRWAELIGQYDRTGLWPLLLTTDPGLSDSGSIRPWHNGELEPDPPEAAERIDVDRMLARDWTQFLDDRYGRDQVPRTWHTWPGLAPRAEPGEDPGAYAASLATTRARSKVGANVPYGGSRVLSGGLEGFTDKDGAYLGLVVAEDSAGAASALGWTHNSPGPAELTAVFRSWQRRFGVRLCAYGFDALAVSVAWPPRTLEHARRLAVEHIAFCEDSLVDDTFEAYAEALVDAGVWSFWWD